MRSPIEHIRAASPLISHATVVHADDGLVAIVQLDPLLVQARAREQGLADWSVAAAARDPRVRRLLAAAVDKANHGRPADEHITRLKVAR